MSVRTVITAHIKITFLVIVAISFVLGVAATLWYQNMSTQEPQNQILTGQNGLINPLLSCDVGEKPSQEISTLMHTISSTIDDLNSENEIDTVGFFYLDLNSGQRIGVNSDTLFEPSSMLKVGVMMVYYKEAEHDPSILNQEIVDTDTSNTNERMYFKPKETIQVGQKYTVEDLIERMIKYSDNSATILLMENADKQKYYNIYHDLGLKDPEKLTNLQDFMSPREYATFYRVLYNATYLNQDMSAKALQLLLYDDFPQGITGSLPANIPNAQKYGENVINNEAELHDCGIVYYPHRPYLLCIMTKGNNFDAMARGIRKLSQIVYQQVNAADKK